MRRILLGTTAVITVAAAIALVSVPAAAHPAVAHTLGFTGSVSGAPSSGDYPNTATLDIPAFNSNDGTLTSVLVFENLSVNYSGAPYFTTSMGTSYTDTLQALTPLSITNGPAYLDGSPVLTAGVTVSGVTFDGTSPSSFSGSNTQSSGALPMTDLSDWELSGGGTLVANLATTTTESPMGGALVFAPTPSITFSFHGSYNYTTTANAIPEPASALMLGGGVLALGAVRRRRKRKAEKG